MSKYFGKTWWGQQWLKSLANIDYSNRLPRGSSYARNGSVSSLEIKENQIQAKVKGSQPKPYNVTIIIPPFFDAQIKKLVKGIAEKPLIVSRLLNKDLDPEVLTIAEQNGMKVFPEQWTDFKMQCSCPDWAVPCKHLAAVIYKVSSEIDNNPFLAFSLHRLDLQSELKKENIHISGQDETEIPMLVDLLIPKKIKGEKSKSEKKGEQNPADRLDAYQKLNFSTLSPINEPLIQLLSPAPPFYPDSGDFKEKYAQVIRNVVRKAVRLVTEKSEIEEYFEKKKGSQKGSSREVSISHHTEISIFVYPGGVAEVFLSEKDKSFPMNAIIPALWKIPSSALPDYQPSMAAVKNMLLLAVNLIANGAIVPHLVRVEKDINIIRWLPATLSTEVKMLINQAESLLPAKMFYFAGKAGHEIKADRAMHLLSFFITELVAAFSTPADDLIQDFFFSKKSNRFDKPGQKSLAGGINQWLKPYYLSQGKYKSVLIVEELPKQKFQLDVTIEETKNALSEKSAIRDVFRLKKFDKDRFEILQAVTQLNSLIPGLDKHINSRGEETIVMDSGMFAPFLMQAIPAIQLLDIQVLLPKSLQNLLKPKPTIRVSQKTESGKSFMRLDKLLDFNWQVAVGDHILDEAEFKKLLKNSEGLIKYKSEYIYVSTSDLEKLHKHFSSSGKLSQFEIMRAALSNDYYGSKIVLTTEVKKMIESLKENKVIPLPKALQATMRPYQLRGYSWLYRNSKIGFGSVLADDMGLGKTLQVITALAKFKEEGSLEKEKVLVIAPTGLLTNWQAEIEKFAPSLKCFLYHGTLRQLDKKRDYDILLTSYGIVRSDVDVLKKMKWFVVVTDEAQNIKNIDTAQTKAVKSIPSGSFIAMSGTPVENRLTELWSIMDFSNRGFLGSVKEFKETFAIPIQNQNDITAAEKLKAVTSPFLMRRLKSDKTIISDLPDKIEMDAFGSLTSEQASLYEKTLEKALQEIEGIKNTDKKSLFVRQGLVLQMILALKQICNHPTQFLKNKVLKASLSGKMELLFDRLEAIVESNEKVLIFTQFTEMGDLLKHFIAERFGEEPLYYHGGCSLKQRKEMVDAFQTNRADKIFILSLKAAGTGLNLTAASHVIHYDLWWNPAVEAQATDRAYRIGQKSNVMVHRFITKGTFEERINEMIQSKKQLAGLTVASGENWIGNLSNKELSEVFSLG